jgi:hypothetical protein
MSKFITKLKSSVENLTSTVNGIKELVAKIKESDVISHIKAIIEFFDSIRQMIEKYKQTQSAISELEDSAVVEAAVEELKENETETTNNNKK